MRIQYIALSVGLLLVVGLSLPEALAEDKSGSEASPTARDTRQRSEAAFDQRIKSAVDLEVEKVRTTTEKKVEEATRRLEDRLSRQISMVGLFLTVISLLTAAFIAVGILENKRINEIREQAEKTLKTMEKIREEAETSSTTVKENVATMSKELDRMREGLRSAGKAMESVFKTMPLLDHDPRPGPSDEISTEDQIQWKDYDIIILTGDSLGMVEHSSQSAEHFVKLATFWRATGNYAKALARSKRAVELAPGDWQAHLDVGTSLVYWISANRDLPQYRDLVDQGRFELEHALVLQKGQGNSKTLHQLGWIYDELGEFQRAIDSYRQARVKDREEAAFENRPERLFIPYNMACALAKGGKLADALQVLEEVLKQEPAWGHEALREAEFATLRDSVEHRNAFFNIVGDAIAALVRAKKREG